jgi:hypothetical protein
MTESADLTPSTLSKTRRQVPPSVQQIFKLTRAQFKEYLASVASSSSSGSS